MKTKTTLFSQGVLRYTQKDDLTEFHCERCDSIKKSKTIVQWETRDKQVKTICNSCYGYLLSKE